MTDAATVTAAAETQVFVCRNCETACTKDRTAVFQYRTVAADGSTRWKKQAYTIWVHIESGVEKCPGHRTLNAWPGRPAERRAM